MSSQAASESWPGARCLRRVVYRSNADLALPEWFLLPDEQGLLGGGVERAFISTTPNRAVALGYAMAYRHTQELTTLFEIEVGKTSVGADISPFSQFEEEKEFLYPPLTVRKKRRSFYTLL
jgi:hypothetical protein